MGEMGSSKSSAEDTWDELDVEYAAKAWNGGSRAFELFRKEREEIALKRYKEDGSRRLDEINEQLQTKLDNTERAGLLTEKAWINLALFDGVSALETATTCLLKSVQLDPDNQEYIQHLTQIYEEIWHDPKFEVNDNPSNELKALRNKVMMVVNAYRIGRE